LIYFETAASKRKVLFGYHKISIIRIKKYQNPRISFKYVRILMNFNIHSQNLIKLHHIFLSGFLNSLGSKRELGVNKNRRWSLHWTGMHAERPTLQSSQSQWSDVTHQATKELPHTVGRCTCSQLAMVAPSISCLCCIPACISLAQSHTTRPLWALICRGRSSEASTCMHTAFDAFRHLPSKPCYFGGKVCIASVPSQCSNFIFIW
jgi:hypothetical protein